MFNSVAKIANERKLFRPLSDQYTSQVRMMKAITLTLGVALMALSFGCATTNNSSALTQRIDAVQKQFAPDRHLAIFNVEAERRGKAVVLRGEVNDAAAKQAVIQAVGEVTPNVTDEITVLPQEKLGDKTFGISIVSAATVREERGPGAELGTQILLGHTFKIWKADGIWFYVQSKDGYLGWIERDQFVACTAETVNSWSNATKVIVTAFADHVWKDSTKTIPVCDVVPGCLLKYNGNEGEWTKVELADGRKGVVASQSVADYNEWKKSRTPTAEAIELTAKSLLGTPYLWGGTSTKMLDCSGFTKTVYFLNGIDLLRNASHQFRQGTPIEPGAHLENLKKGDLLFFGRKNRDGTLKATHVGIYLENGLFIHSSGLVHISSLDPKSELRDEARIKGLIGARRILPN